jgi:hypothetical protein
MRARSCRGATAEVHARRSSLKGPPAQRARPAAGRAVVGEHPSPRRLPRGALQRLSNRAAHPAVSRSPCRDITPARDAEADTNTSTACARLAVRGRRDDRRRGDPRTRRRAASGRGHRVSQRPPHSDSRRCARASGALVPSHRPCAVVSSLQPPEVARRDPHDPSGTPPIAELRRTQPGPERSPHQRLCEPSLHRHRRRVGAVFDQGEMGAV